jgi:hypothetical protein
MAMQIESRDVPRAALVLIAFAAFAAVVAPSAAQDVRRPDGTVVRPITVPEPTPRSGYDPGSALRLEQEAASKMRAEENERRVEEILKQREAQVERARRERDAAADRPSQRQ